jgi:transcriptional regulator with XRE-family HTH domain
MKLNELKSHREVVEQDLMTRPGYRAEMERTAVARAVATALVRYRAQHGLSQRGLAKVLGWAQPQVARLEIGEHNPSLETLSRLSIVLGMHFIISVGKANPQQVQELTDRGTLTLLDRRPSPHSIMLAIRVIIVSIMAA